MRFSIMAKSFEKSLAKLLKRPPTQFETEEALRRLSTLFNCLSACEREENEKNGHKTDFSTQKTINESAKWTTYQISEPE